jgi:pimeloyl-ACP methyl ester carboxylesterase
MNDSTVRLPDGRRLGYSTIGATEGPTALYFHSSPGSRLLPPVADEAGRKYGLRIIGVDRPGLGLSDFQPGRRLSDWPADVRALLDHLGLERVGVLGVSAGGPYVLSCCHAIPDRISRAIIVSGITDGARPALISDQSPVPRVLLPVLRRSLLACRAVYRLLSFVSRKNPERAQQELARGLAAPDARVLERPDAGPFILEAWAEGTRNGVHGWAYDDHVLSRPWDFSPAQIRDDVQIEMWYGEHDLVTKPESYKRLIDSLGGANLTVFPGEGHVLVFDHMEDVARAFVQR